MFTLDAHLDLSLNAIEYNRDLRRSVREICEDEVSMTDLKGRSNCTVAFPEMREAGIGFLRESHEAGRDVFGFEVDDVCRQFLVDAGYGDYFVHRTGHSMDLELHGSGPNLDNLETRDDRLLVPGVGFSIEPGIYLPDDVGIRSEINVHFGADGPEVTPRERQDEILLLID